MRQLSENPRCSWIKLAPQVISTMSKTDAAIRPKKQASPDVSANIDGGRSRAGRRPKAASDSESAGLTRETIVAHALSLAQDEPVSEITTARLARDLGVAPGLIYYFMGSRDDLLSAVFNEALKRRVAQYPALTGHWREDMEALLKQTLRFQLQWKGITTYVATNNRYRLFQRVEPGQTDYGLVFFDRLGRILESGGFSPDRAAMAYHLLMLFMTSVANAHVQRQEPSQHQPYLLDHLAMFSPTDYPGAHFLMPAFAKITTDATVGEGLQLLLDHIDGWRHSADTHVPLTKPAS
jgi:AcrR family transcriptional regulator